MHNFILGSLSASFRWSPDSKLEGQYSAVKNVSNELNENESNTSSEGGTPSAKELYQLNTLKSSL